MSVEGPVIIDEHGALEVHPDAQTAVSGLEAIDVLNDEYEAFDANGECLDLLVLNQRIVLRRRVAPETDRAGVAGRLHRAGRAYEPSQFDDLDLEQANLNELVPALLVVKLRRLRWPGRVSCRSLIRSRRWYFQRRAQPMISSAGCGFLASPATCSQRTAAGRSAAMHS